MINEYKTKNTMNFELMMEKGLKMIANKIHENQYFEILFMKKKIR